MLILVLALAGVAGIVVGWSAFRFVRSAAGAPGAGNLAALQRIAIVVGFALGIASWPLTGLMRYPYGTPHEVGHIAGLPFFVAYFDAAGHDYLGSLSLPSLLGNAVFWGLCPQVVLAGHVAVRRRRRRETSPKR